MEKIYTIMGQDSLWIKSIKFFRVSMNYTRKTKIKENDQLSKIKNQLYISLVILGISGFTKVF